MSTPEAAPPPGGPSLERPRLPASTEPLAAFGNAALKGGDLDVLLHRACVEVAAMLGVRYAKVLEYLPDERQLLVRAGHGWAEGVVGVARLAADLGSPAGFALQTGVPTIANDLASEMRFRIPDLLRAHGVVSAVNVVIMAGEFVFGVLEADSPEPRSFDERDCLFLQGYANILALTIAQTRLMSDKTALSRRAETALEELRHRVKNNNQILLSLLRLKKRRHHQLETVQVLDDVIGQVLVLNRLDDLIAQAGGIGAVHLGSYVTGVLNSLMQVEDGKSSGLRLEADLDDLAIDSRRAQAVAMIVNEFVTNSLKYGIEGSDGSLRVALRRAGDEAVLALEDGGPGIPADVKRGTGMRLIAAMCDTLGTRPEWIPGSGAHLRITFRV